jgi:hypothetical protein
MKTLVLILTVTTCLKAFASPIDCSQVYGTPAKCEQVTCDDKQKTFLGTWTGPFQSYAQELSTAEKSIFRPFQNSVTYTKSDCLKNIENGDVFIVGHRTDNYPEFRSLPAKTQAGLLVTGTRADGTPFLKTIDADGINSYSLVYKNPSAVFAVWNLTISATANMPEMRFTTIDGRDFLATDSNKRNVVVTMSLGPVEKPIWEGVVSQGSHTLQP